MSPPHHSRLLALILSLVPGWGHVYLGRERAGLCLFTLAAISLFGMLNILLVYSGEHRLLLARSAGGGAVFSLLLSVVDVLRRTSPSRLRRIDDEKARLLRGGMIAYLRNDLEGAEETFRACLRLDGQEVEALLRIGVVTARRGAARRARRWLRRARRMDLDEKWGWEIERELEALRAPPAPGGPGRVAWKRAVAAGTPPPLPVAAVVSAGEKTTRIVEAAGSGAERPEREG